jgi:DNA-binding NtrC family response regulator
MRVASRPSAGSSGGDERVAQVPSLLIVDPDPKLATSLGELLTGRGFESLSASSGEQALQILGDVSVDLVLTEARLPGMTGFDLIRTARRKDPMLAFMVLTDTENFRFALDAIRLGARDYLVKQVDRIDFLVATIERGVRQVRRERESRDLLVQLSALQEEFLRNLVHLEHENAVLQEKLAGGSPQQAAHYRVLIVDDEPVVCKVLAELFTTEGFLVHTTVSAEDAITLLARTPIDLVVADKNLPRMNGIELLRCVKATAPGIEFLIITGYGSLDSAIAAMDSGAAGYLLKPFSDLSEILSKVREIRAKQEFRARAAQFLERFKVRNRAFIEKYQEMRRRLSDLAGQEKA